MAALNTEKINLDNFEAILDYLQSKPIAQKISQCSFLGALVFYACSFEQIRNICKSKYA